MGRPRRPDAERVAVLAAAGTQGSVQARAVRLAKRVVADTMAEIDRDPAERVIALLRDLDPTPLRALATDPEIDTAAVIRAERQARLDGRGGRRLPELEWPIEDREVARAAVAILAKRYARMIRAG
jgi:hypothetical protein